MGGPWGWKDPRNTFTLPLWLELFPEARVLHVTRHGVDVAASLRYRQRKGLAAAASRGWQWRYGLIAKRAGIVDTLRCAGLEGGLALWEEYVIEGRRRVEDMGERAMELQYESVLADPVERMASVARFCGLEVTPEALRSAVGEVNPARAFAYRRDPELAQFADTHSERLARFGYG